MDGTVPSQSQVPEERLRPLNDHPIDASKPYVLYWMTAFHRISSNFALQRAVDWARYLQKPLLVLETLIVDYPWASDRIHRFFLEAMADNAKGLEGLPGVRYYAYVEREKGGRQGLLEDLGRQAAVVVTDDYPIFIPAKLTQVAGKQFAVRTEAVDSNGLLPLSTSPKEFPTAYVFRRFFQNQARPHLRSFPHKDPLKGGLDVKAPDLPQEFLKRWPQADVASLLKDPDFLLSLPLDHSVPPVEGTVGGSCQAHNLLDLFLKEKLSRYAEERSEPSLDLSSGLAPYLHFGHISIHEVFAAVAQRENWKQDKLAPRATGSKEGWWGMGVNAESFLDEAVIWREVGYHFCRHRADHDQYGSLPLWARQSLEAHRSDPREYIYSLEDLEQGRTHDPLWNAAQNQLREEGRIHNYLRMLWGKKILEWTENPRQALRVMIELNNKWALDGRDPNSYSGIFWCLGRFDRPWAPVRPIFGAVRYMSSGNTAKKFNVKGYLAAYGGPRTLLKGGRS